MRNIIPETPHCPECEDADLILFYCDKCDEEYRLPETCPRCPICGHTQLEEV